MEIGIQPIDTLKRSPFLNDEPWLKLTPKPSFATSIVIALISPSFVKREDSFLKGYLDSNLLLCILWVRDYPDDFFTFPSYLFVSSKKCFYQTLLLGLKIPPWAVFMLTIMSLMPFMFSFMELAMFLIMFTLMLVALHMITLLMLFMFPHLMSFVMSFMFRFFDLIKPAAL